MSELRDLGYERYVGPREAASKRWRVIMRHQMASAWKTWWRYKAALGLAVITTAIWGALMFFLSNRLFRGMGASDIGVTFTDAALPMSIEWFCRVAFYASLTLGAGVLASDVQSGAFTLYFSRSVQPRDYVIGKIAGYGALVAILVMIGPIVLAVLRLSLYDTPDEALQHWTILPKAAALGALMAVVYTLVPLGFSALLPGQRYSLALWATYYLIVGTVVQTVGFLEGGSIAALDLPTAVAAVGFDVFDVHPMFGRRAAWQLSTTVAVIAIAVHAVLAVLVIWRGVAKAQRAGVGGAS